MTITENFSKNKRGRPIKYSEDLIKSLYRSDPELQGHTKRHLQNSLLMSRAYTTLEKTDKEKYSWLLGANEYGLGVKKTILTELGRIFESTPDIEILLSLADWVCEEKPKTTEIVPFLRGIRLESQNKGSLGVPE